MYVANVEGRLTTFSNGGPVDVAHASGGRFESDIQRVYDRWDDFLAWGHTINAFGKCAHGPTKLGALVPQPRQVFAVGLNYSGHANETGLAPTQTPTTFTKFPSCIVGPDIVVELASDTTDWEVELVAVVARRAHRVRAADAWGYVAGLTIGQDISERTLQFADSTRQFSLGKSYPGYGPLGPFLVTPDEFPDPDDLAITCTIDGELVQAARTSEMIFSVGALIERLSAVCPLLPGDLIFTGTPAGVGFAQSPQRFLKPGQEIVSEIEGIGRLVTRTTHSAAGGDGGRAIGSPSAPAAEGTLAPTARKERRGRRH
ncbi:fumarylacetoacetate hydrolase family protein [Mycobacterium vicinigordonae]|uniref:Fumarylacetoacetate hydrolase family protein n=1 Tax=Mycobacterium vicinigordonae TaxID=1719132 RepID=A0A7D6DXF3_9MYCO|nr:fumarylacetoacetate hydrolase family protein [Mycobacterium vicinigordonae]QLL06249.1 fumarylacetoacetate hydrolase family protein [Mycobacterium vicinigordonae]